LAAATEIPLPSRLVETAVLVNGNAIPLLFVSPEQINAQLPYETPAGPVKLQVESQGKTGPAVTIRVDAVAPGIMLLDASHALLWSLTDGRLNGADAPVKPGEYAMAYVTGQGAVAPAVDSGGAAPLAPLSYPTGLVEVKIGGIPAEVQFAGLAPGFVGLLQLNVRVPDVSSGERALELTIGGVAAKPAVIFVGAN
jgi:uncharacterized protein (TIGR03437 family)